MKIRNFVIGFLATATMGLANAAVYTVQFDNTATANDPTITLDGQVVDNTGLSFLDGYRANAASLIAGSEYTIDSIFSNAYSNNQTLHLTVTRGSDNVFTTYFNGVVEYSFEDVSGTHLFTPGSVMSLFAEGLVTLGYYRFPDSSINYVTLYDHALTGDQVTNLGVVPEPQSLALALAGLVMIGTLHKRRKAA